MSTRASTNLVTIGSLRGRKISKVSIFKYIILMQKTKESNQTNLRFFHDFGTLSSFLKTKFLEVNVRVSVKVITSDSFNVN